MNIALCESAGKQKFNAGNKAREDVLTILKNNGYCHVMLFQNGKSKFVIVFQMLCACIKTFVKAGKGDTVFMQYPYYPSILNKLLFRILGLGKRIKKYRMSLIIHDVLSLRNEKLNTTEGIELLRNELKTLSIFDRIICHNGKMQEIFQKASSNSKYEVLGPFDYIYEKEPILVKWSSKPKVVIAGNLSKNKCGYLYKLPELKNIVFNLYGLDYTGRDDDFISYKGKFPPNELIEHLDGNFGLVWDGDSYETCTGVFGQYLKYNNPHKFSLYLAAGIPLIVWSESALSSYVKENNIGICVDSLGDLDDAVNGINEEQYKMMVKNVLRIREGIVRGQHLASFT